MRPIYLLLTCALIGCANPPSTPAPEPVEAVEPLAALEDPMDEEPDIVTMPVDSLIYGDQEFDQLLRGSVQAILTHNWEMALTYCDSENVDMQMGMGIGAKQYLYELFNLKTPEGVEYIEYINSTMGNVDQILFETAQEQAWGDWNGYAIKGFWLLKDTRKVPMTVQIIQRINGPWVFIGAVG